MKARVVITGLGPVTTCGTGLADFERNLWDMQCQPAPVPEERAPQPRSKWFLPLPTVSLTAFGLSPAQESLLQPEDRMALSGVRLALLDAGFELRRVEGRFTVTGLEKADVIFGTGLSGMQTALESYAAHIVPQEILSQCVPSHRLMFSRMVVPKSMPDSPAAWTSILFGLSGTCFTLNASCASGTYAIGEAFRRIQWGVTRVALAGGVEALHDEDGFIMRGFDTLGVLTQSANGHPEPFSQHRSGFLFAEGGAFVLVLEELQHALSRGARIYAEVRGFESNSDAWNIMQIEPSARRIQQMLRTVVVDRRIDYVNAHGTGTIPNDEIEARVYTELFGQGRGAPLVNSTKGLLGHTLGASGAIEAAVTALSIARGKVHGNLTHDPLPGLNAPLTTQPADIETAISVSFGFGGHNGALLFTRYQPHVT